MTLRKCFHICLIATLLLPLLAFQLGCNAGGGAPPPPPPPTSFTIMSVSPTTVDEGAILTITYSGPDPGLQGNPIMATFQQGTLPTRQGKFIGSDSLGNNSFRVFFQVPNGLASDAGIIPLPSTVTLATSQSTSAAQHIQIAPPPSLVIFPEELYLGDTNVSVRVHGNNTHFDPSTAVSGSGELQITSTTIVSSIDLIVRATVTSSSAGTAMISVSSGGSDPRTQEFVSASLPIAANSSALFRASQLSTTHAPPGAILEIQGLFQVRDSRHHDTVQWVVAGHSITLLPISETSSALKVMVPIWPNSDGSVYVGAAQLQVRGSGNTSQFNFTIDPLPGNTLARGAVFNALLDAMIASIPNLQNDLTAVSSSSQALSAFQAAAGSEQSVVAQLRQFVSAEASGISAIPPGGAQAIPPQQFDFIERILQSSGLFQQVTATNSKGITPPYFSPQPNISVGESTILAAEAACTAASSLGAALHQIQEYLYYAAAGAAVLGLVTAGVDLAPAAVLLEMGNVIGAVAEAPDLLSAACTMFPVSLTQVAFSPGELKLSTSPPQAGAFSGLNGTFSVCASPVPALAAALNKLLSFDLEKYFEWFPDQKLLQQIANQLADIMAGKIIDLIQTLVGPQMSQWLGVGFDTSLTLSVGLTAATSSLFTDDAKIAVPFPGSFEVQPARAQPLCMQTSACLVY